MVEFGKPTQTAIVAVAAGGTKLNLSAQEVADIGRGAATCVQRHRGRVHLTLNPIGTVVYTMSEDEYATVAANAQACVENLQL